MFEPQPIIELLSGNGKIDIDAFERDMSTMLQFMKKNNRKKIEKEETVPEIKELKMYRSIEKEFYSLRYDLIIEPKALLFHLKQLNQYWGGIR